MPIISVLPAKLNGPRTLAHHVQGSFNNLKLFCMALDRYHIFLKLDGHRISTLTSQEDLSEILRGRGATRKTVQDNLGHFFKALDRYQNRYSTAFRRQNLSFVGDWDIEMPLVSGSENEVVGAWLKEMVLANIWNTAEEIESEGTSLYFGGKPVLSEKPPFGVRTQPSWDKKDIHKIFLTLMFFNEAVRMGFIAKKELMNIEDISAPVLGCARSKHCLGIPAGWL